MDDHQASLTADVVTYLQDSSQSPLYGKTVESVQALSGDQNALWRVLSGEQDVVLKMFLDAGQARGRRQFNNQEAAASRGVAPQPISFERYPTGLSRQIMLYHWDSGILLDPLATEHRRQLAFALAEVHSQDTVGHARLSPHPVSPDYQWNLMQGSHRQVNSWLTSQSPDELTVALRHVLSASQSQVKAELEETSPALPALVHGDVYPEHCLVGKQGLRFVDWELAGLGDPAREVAHVLIHVLRGVPDLARQSWQDQYLELMSEPSLSGRIRLYEMMLPVAAFMDLLLHLLPTSGQFASEQAGANTLLHLAFEQCLADVNRTLDLDFESGEVTHLAHIYHSRLGFPVPLFTGANTP